MISLKESMRAPGKVRLPTPGERTSPPPDKVAEQLRAAVPAPGDRDGTTHVPWPSGPRRRPPATAYGAQGCPASPRAALGLARLPRGRRLLPEAGRTWAEAAGSGDAVPGRRCEQLPEEPGRGGRRPRPRQLPQRGRAGRSRPSEGGSGGKSELGQHRGRPAAQNQHSPCLRP